MGKDIATPLEDCQNALRKLEEYALISVIRPGQYFVRQYFTRELDTYFQKNYDDFEV